MRTHVLYKVSYAHIAVFMKPLFQVTEMSKVFIKLRKETLDMKWEIEMCTTLNTIVGSLSGGDGIFPGQCECLIANL